MRPRSLPLPLILAGCLALLTGCDDGSTDGDDPAPDAMLDADPQPDVAEPDPDAAEADAALPEPDAAEPDAAEPEPDAEACERWPSDRLEPEVRDDDWTPESGDLPPELVPADDEFLVAVLPDTQVYSFRTPEIFDSQLRWIAENAERYRIVFVSHVGDIVQNGGAQDQWAVARAAYDWIDDIGLPHGTAIGSHDVGGGHEGPVDSSCSARGRSSLDCDALDYKANFGPEIYQDEPWYGGASPSGQSNYQLIEVDGLQMLWLHILMDTPRPEIEWAGEVIDAHPGAVVHVTTHRYLFDYRLTEVLPTPLDILPAGRFSLLTYNAGTQGLVYNDAITADAFFEEFVARYPNIWAVHCGHVDAEWHQVSTNEAGLPVYEILADYQNMEDGGRGWLRLLKIAPARDEVEVITYSTFTGEVRRNGDGFDHAVQILDDYRRQAQSILDSFGLDEEAVQALLDEVRTPGELQDTYYRSLYCDGQRDSRFVLDVDFDAYAEAGR